MTISAAMVRGSFLEGFHPTAYPGSPNSRAIEDTASRRPSATSVHHEGGGAPDLDDLDALAGLDHLVLVVAARGPHLAALDPHAADALVVGDPLEHHRAAPDERRRAGADRGRQAAVAPRDGRSVPTTMPEAATNTTPESTAPTPSRPTTAASAAPSANGSR